MYENNYLTSCSFYIHNNVLHNKNENTNSRIYKKITKFKKKTKYEFRVFLFSKQKLIIFCLEINKI